ncbi:MAG: acyl-CoA dehydrogenase [Syntrophomonadaceae bacterium]|nr:acyl-CoA dehydrogenase [Syntrophomonadaceae bacterium]
MNFSLTEEQQMIRDMVREFAEKEIKPFAAELDRKGEFPAEIIKKLADLGVLGIPIPEEHGGSGASFLSYIIAIEELSRGCASTGVIVETHTSLGSEPILHWGTPEQKRKYLPRLASGEIIGSFGLTEPNAGSDAGGMQTTAVLDGDEYVINGSKIFISNAGASELTIVFAKTEKSSGVKGISAFIVEKNTPGYIVGSPEDKLGIRASQTCSLTFEDMRVPKENILGKPGEGFKIAMHALDGGRIAIAAQALGIAQAAFEEAIKYSKERIQFGQPIAKFQGVQWMIADMATDIQAARLLTYQAAWLKDEGQKYTKEAAMAKLYASEAAMRHTVKAVQVHGGYGYTMEYPVQRHMRDAKITEIYEGTSEVQRIVIASNILR